MSAESLAKARLEVIDGEGVEEVRGELVAASWMVGMTLWSYTTLTDAALRYPVTGPSNSANHTQHNTA